MMIGGVLQKIGVESVITLPGADLDDYVQAGRASACAVLHPFYERTAALFESAGVKIVGGNPIGANATGQWIEQIGEALDLDPERDSPNGCTVR